MKENFNQTKVRILQYLKYKDISIRKFSEKISISPSNFNEKNMPSALSGDVLSRILTTFEELNPDWLLLGKGEMLRSMAPKPAPSSADSDKIWKEILADKDRRIEELIIENYQIREQVAHIQAVTPPPFRNGLIETELHISSSDPDSDPAHLTSDELSRRSHQYLVSLALRQQETIFVLSETINFNKQ